MLTRLGCVVVCVLLVGADWPGGQLGEARLEFLPGSRWELVKGWEDETPMESRFVIFDPGDEVWIHWQMRRAWGHIGSTGTKVRSSDVRLRMLGSQLEVVLPAGLRHPYGLRLLLKRVRQPQRRRH